MHRTKLVTLALALLTAMACDSRVTGNEGNLVFSYDADDNVLDFNKPIAVGASLDLKVAAVGSFTPVTVTSATTDDASVLAVSGTDANRITVTGVGSGEVLLSVEADGPSEPLTDSVNLTVRVPEVLDLRHSCGPEGGAYLVDSSLYIPFELKMSNGQPVIGYGYYPVAVSDEALLLRDDTFEGQQYMRFDALAPGSVTLTSDIDDTQLDLTLADVADIDGVAEPIAFVLEDIDVGDTNAFYALPSVGGVTVCQANATLEVTSITPTICDVRPTGANASDTDAAYETGWFEVEGLSQGTCTYQVTYPDGNGGAGASAEFTHEIQP